MLVLLSYIVAMLTVQSAAPGGPVFTTQTDHLMLSAAASVDAVAPNDRISLLFEVQPRPRMHIYAPGKHAYQVVTISIDSQPWLRVHQTQYPTSEIYHFKPLDERVPVYQKPFRLTKDVTILATPAAQKILAGRKSVTLSGRFEYQACDEKLCYRAQSVPLQWKLALKPLRKPSEGRQ